MIASRVKTDVDLRTLRAGTSADRSLARLRLSLRMVELDRGIRAGTTPGVDSRGELARIKAVLR